VSKKEERDGGFASSKREKSYRRRAKKKKTESILFYRGEKEKTRFFLLWANLGGRGLEKGKKKMVPFKRLMPAERAKKRVRAWDRRGKRKKERVLFGSVGDKGGLRWGRGVHLAHAGAADREKKRSSRTEREKKKRRSWWAAT